MSVSPADSRNEQFVEDACVRASRLIQAGVPLSEGLAILVWAAETGSGDGSVSSILLIDEDGLLRNGASPNLPSDYLLAIDRLKPDPGVGTCAAAAATGRVVFTPDFRADDKWAELRHLPMELGFAGAWSMPIKDSEGRVLGTFGTYFRQCREPTEPERQRVERLVDAASMLIAARRN